MVLFLDSYSDSILPCFFGIQESVVQGDHENRVGIYRLSARTLTLDAKKRIWNISLGFLHLEEHTARSVAFVTCLAVFEEKGGSCFKCVEFLRRIQTQGLRVFTHHPSRGGLC